MLSCFCLQAANFFWGVWALIQACNSTIDFDYLGYVTMYTAGEYGMYVIIKHS